MGFKKKASVGYMAMCGNVLNNPSNRLYPALTLRNTYQHFNSGNNTQNAPSIQIGNGVWGLPLWSIDPIAAGANPWMAANAVDDDGYKVSYNQLAPSNDEDIYTDNCRTYVSPSILRGNEYTWWDARGIGDDDYISNNTYRVWWIYAHGAHATWNRYTIQIENCNFSNWQPVLQDPHRYRNSLIGSGTAVFRWYNCKFINTDIQPREFRTAGSSHGYPWEFHNCLLVNSSNTANCGSYRHCTFINSQVGNEYNQIHQGNTIVDFKFYDNYMDENSILYIGTTSHQSYGMHYDFKSNIMKGRMVIRRVSNDTASTQQSPTGNTWAYSVANAPLGAGSGTITYDFRSSNSDRDLHLTYFLDHPTHFNATYAPFNDGIHTGIYKPSLIDNSNANIFNMKDSHLGTTNNNKFVSSIVYTSPKTNRDFSGQTCMDYTLKTGSTQTLDIMVTGSTDGFPIGYHGVAASYNAADTAMFPVDGRENVTVANTYDWTLPAESTTGSVESNIMDMGESKYIKINKHELPQLDYGPSHRRAGYSDDFGRHNYSQVPMQVASCSYDIRTDVMTNGDFSGGATGWDVATSTSGNTKGYQGWALTDGAWHITAATYTTSTTDPTYTNYSVLSQSNCFDIDKVYFVRVYHDHDQKLKAADTAGYGVYGMLTGVIYYTAMEEALDYGNAFGRVAPEYSGHIRQPYSSSNNYGAMNNVDQFQISGATGLRIRSAGTRRCRITKVEAFEVTQQNQMTNHTLQLKFGDTISACNSASYKTVLYNEWVCKDGSNVFNGEQTFQPFQNETKISARYIKVKLWFNNNFVHL